MPGARPAYLRASRVRYTVRGAPLAVLPEPPRVFGTHGTLGIGKGGLG